MELSYVYFDVCFICLGLILGSFIKCYADRFCQSRPFVCVRSRCDYCGHTLAPRDLIPLFSYIVSKGTCRYCGAKLSKLYPLSELIMAFVCLAIYKKYGLNLECLFQLILWSACLGIALCDLNCWIIPSTMVLIGIVNRVLSAAFCSFSNINLWKGFLSSFVITLLLWMVIVVMEKCAQREMMGRGDLNLYFMLGIYCDVAGQLTAMFLSCVLGILFAMAMGIKKGNKTFPFAPSIIVAYFLIIVVDNLSMISVF